MVDLTTASKHKATKLEDEDEPGDLFSELYRVGLAILVDDAPDFPELISTWGKEPGKHGVLKDQTMPDLPPHPHHWVIGALIMLGSAVGKIVYAVDSSRQLNEIVQQV